MISTLQDRFNKEHLVYRFMGDLHSTKEELPEGIGLSSLEDETVRERYFGKDVSRKKVFARFAEQGSMGLLLHTPHEWVTYAWMARPSGPQPPHLPRQARGYFWIFWCHTHENFRRQGHYQRALRLLLAAAADEVGHQRPPVYIDTNQNNEPSRRAIARTGFAPYGQMQAVTLPRIPPFKGQWSRNQPHPVL